MTSSMNETERRVTVNGKVFSVRNEGIINPKACARIHRDKTLVIEPSFVRPAAPLENFNTVAEKEHEERKYRSRFNIYLIGDKKERVTASLEVDGARELIERFKYAKTCYLRECDRELNTPKKESSANGVPEALKDVYETTFRMGKLTGKTCVDVLKEEGGRQILVNQGNFLSSQIGKNGGKYDGANTKSMNLIRKALKAFDEGQLNFNLSVEKRKDLIFPLYGWHDRKHKVNTYNIDGNGKALVTECEIWMVYNDVPREDTQNGGSWTEGSPVHVKITNYRSAYRTNDRGLTQDCGDKFDLTSVTINLTFNEALRVIEGMETAMLKYIDSAGDTYSKAEAISICQRLDAKGQNATGKTPTPRNDQKLLQQEAAIKRENNVYPARTSSQPDGPDELFSSFSEEFSNY